MGFDDDFWRAGCKYWDPYTGESTDGECKRNAPKAYVPDEGRICYATWPQTNCSDWCGEGKISKKGETNGKSI